MTRSSSATALAVYLKGKLKKRMRDPTAKLHAAAAAAMKSVPPPPPSFNLLKNIFKDMWPMSSL
jgi:hypothetical protein